VTHPYTHVQLDALRELSNVASGTAATALSQLLGREVELSVPLVQSLPLTEAVEALGAPDDLVSGVAMAVEGDIEATVLLVMPSNHADNLCLLLSVEPGSEVGDSALREIGNILGAAYLRGLESMTGLTLLPCPPRLGTATLANVLRWALAQRAGSDGAVLVLDSELDVAEAACSLSFLLLPSTHGALDLLTPLGLAEPTA
jgi:chemotaxis protein CheC